MTIVHNKKFTGGNATGNEQFDRMMFTVNYSLLERSACPSTSSSCAVVLMRNERGWQKVLRLLPPSISTLWAMAIQPKVQKCFQEQESGLLQSWL